MEIECISLREQLNALVVIYMKSREVSSHTGGRKNVNVPALRRDSPSPPFPAGTTLLTECNRKWQQPQRKDPRRASLTDV